MEKKILSAFDVVTISQVLNSEIPELVIDSITIIETGWDHLVAEVNEEWIFRFPRAEGSIANLEREKNLLDYLRNHITLPIPYHHYFGINIAFVGYRKLLGIHLNQQIYANLDLKVCHHIANTIASFFTELHHAVSKEQALEWGYAPVIRPLLEIESLLSTLPRDIGIMVKSAIDYARIDLSEDKNLVFIHQDINGDNLAFDLTEDKNLVFIHQDINGDNLAFDLTSEQITGAFDFSDTGIGPYSWEFAELFVVDVELARLTAQIYAMMNNVPNPLIGGAADYILRKATWILDTRKKGNSQKEKKFLEGLHYFLPIWRDVASIAAEK